LFVGSKDNNSIYKINIGTINQTKKWWSLLGSFLFMLWG
jgi:hypothetical protein